ncbi:MAG TPA: class I SAM-dependent rRNA methyltransferase [Candidatus Tectomicrobia bacterium]|nr:class I SAM-dependent rRNA methyltransferase [Candidatus Tectomicrobia bacterium]
MSQQAVPLHIHKGHERRLLLGHPWVFSNEIASDLRQYEPGSLVDVYTHGGTFVGRGYINPRSLITVRILARQREVIDSAFFRRRIEAALRRRERLFPGAQSYRLVYSEGDLLPGLIIDRYADHAVLQTLTLGMELRTEAICEALEAIIQPRAIVARNDVGIRNLEGLAQEKKVLRGSLQTPIEVWELDVRFHVDPWEGQKTGFYLDQRDNRCTLRPLLAGERVLDAFCYTGAWALHAARAGAKEVVAVDESTKAIQCANDQAKDNGLEHVCQFTAADVFDVLKEADTRHERFDCIILDPPAFVKSRSKVREGLQGYWEINRRAMRLLKPGGYLITCSCSYHVDPDTFRTTLSRAARAARRSAVLLEMRSQARDHPVLLPVSEMAYLKCAVLSLVD